MIKSKKRKKYIYTMFYPFCHCSGWCVSFFRNVWNNQKSVIIISVCLPSLPFETVSHQNNWWKTVDNGHHLWLCIIRAAHNLTFEVLDNMQFEFFHLINQTIFQSSTHGHTHRFRANYGCRYMLCISGCCYFVCLNLMTVKPVLTWQFSMLWV